jgi:hypothetical protein
MKDSALGCLPAGLVRARTTQISGIAASSQAVQNATRPLTETPITMLPATQAVP